MSSPRIIKKYPNRRLYDTGISSYVTLEDVRQLILEREDFVVRDARSGADLTRGVLLQIIAEHDDQGPQIFTNALLTEVIRLRGDTLQGFIGSFLERSLQVFLEQQQSLRAQISSLVGQSPWALVNQLAEKNLEIWRALHQGLTGGKSSPRSGRRGR